MKITFVGMNTVKKAWSSWVFVGMGVLAGLDMYIPAIRDLVSAKTYLVLSVVGFVARAIKQQSMDQQK